MHNVHALSVFRAIELANSLQVSEAMALPQVEHSSEFVSEFSVYWMGKSLFDLREYRRAAHALRLCKSDEAFFLKCYSLYLVGGVYNGITINILQFTYYIQLLHSSSLSNHVSAYPCPLDSSSVNPPIYCITSAIL